MERAEFRSLADQTFGSLFGKAKKNDEFAFLFAILGINSGEEDIGWQPVNETQNLISDIAGLLQGPLYDDAKLRLALLLYCHVIEASYHYHCIYNLLLTIDGQTPLVFSFLDKYRKGIPPSLAVKIGDIGTLADKHGEVGVRMIFKQIIRPDIRNAFFHSDYIIFDGELRLKHRGSEIAKIPQATIFELLQNTIDFFQMFLNALALARKSFPKDHIIRNRKSSKGTPLASVEILFHEDGSACGFSMSDPLPMW